MDKFDALQKIGQSLWYDNIERKLLENGDLKALIDQGEIRGVTSNPTIFNKAISSSSDYDDALKTLAWAGWEDPEEIFYRLAIEDIQAACDLFTPVYESSNGLDGFVSLEVNPKLATDTKKTITEAANLWKSVGRRNLMIKIPATLEGLPAIRRSIAEGINVNVTLIFSISRYEQVIEAYIEGLEDRVKNGKPVDRIASVASFFVSRMDSKIDKRLAELLTIKPSDSEKIKRLMGKAAISNTRLAYQLFEKKFTSDRFSNLLEQGANCQRPLWASTSTKNPDYPDTLYIEELIAKNSVNTVPPKTLDAFREHGSVSETIHNDLDISKKITSELEELGISIDQVTQELEDEGVESFVQSYLDLLDSIKKRSQEAVAELGGIEKMLSSNLKKIDNKSIVERIFDKDPTLWTTNEDEYFEIKHRLDWLEAPETSHIYIDEINQLRNELVSSGFNHGVVLGMGGSSLAPEVFANVFSSTETLGLSISILDSTDPQHVQNLEAHLPIEKTIFIVSSKSGTTSEVHAFLDHFWQVVKDTGNNNPGEQFVAVTDTDTPLHKLGLQRNFRKVFQANPNVGGRYSALTAFGLVPAGLMGIDLELLLTRSSRFEKQCKTENPIARNPGAILGAIIASATQSARDKLTILADNNIVHFGSWLEQLIAESSGKQNKGIIPIDLEPKTEVEHYNNDRIFIYLRQSGEFDSWCKKLRESEHPVITFNIKDNYEIGAEFYRWEFATAVACSMLGINAFDQPDVQDSKQRTAEKLADFSKTGMVKQIEPSWENDQFAVFDSTKEKTPGNTNIKELVSSFLKQNKPGDYIAINAYLPRNPQTLADLQKLRQKVLELTDCATSLGFGPRFLHSTGQLHKGGPNNCMIIQITKAIGDDVSIPGKYFTFGTLINAQAMGDLEALISRNRRILSINLKKEIEVSEMI